MLGSIACFSAKTKLKPFGNFEDFILSYALRTPALPYRPDPRLC